MSAVAELTERQEMVLDALDEYHIEAGSHTEYQFNEKTACIMESLCLVLGYNPDALPGGNNAPYLTPPCISEHIATIMVEINDSIKDDTDRDRLKPLAALILNTAPTYKRGSVTFKKKSNKDYKRVEKQRIYKSAEFFGTHVDENWSGQPELGYFLPSKTIFQGGIFQYDKVENYIRELVDMGKFENGELIK
jgi:hypothetical protein